MTFREFEDLAWHYWEEIPEEYKEGVDGLVVERGALPHPTMPDIYTLGECVTEAYPSEFGGPDTIRSAVVLYYGSFWRLSRLDPEFDWEDELWETLTHELKHHLEWLADEDALEALDYAVDESFKRNQGEPFDPLYYRSGEEVTDGVWKVERDFYLEQEYPANRPPGPETEFAWHGRMHLIPVPADPGDVCFITIDDGLLEPPDGEVCVVLVRKQPLGRALASLCRRREGEVRETGARAGPVDESHGGKPGWVRG